MQLLKRKRPANIRETTVAIQEEEDGQIKTEDFHKKEEGKEEQKGKDKSQESQLKDQSSLNQVDNDKSESIVQAKKPATSTVGPVKNSIRQPHFSISFDYARGLCKDYNETGFCGFGDSCIFLHDRGDYKSGWELDLEWEEEQRRRLVATERKARESKEKALREEEKRIEQQTCGLCTQEFTLPMVETKCGHRFCEKCALKHSKTSKTCPVCETVIDGQFRIVRLMTTPKSKEAKE